MTLLAYACAAVTEIAGCFAFRAWLRLDKSPWWLIPGGLSLAVFAYMLTLVETDAAGRAFAAYGGVYIFASLLWLWAVDGVRPDRWDTAGVCICLLGAAVILLSQLVDPAVLEKMKVRPVGRRRVRERDRRCRGYGLPPSASSQRSIAATSTGISNFNGASNSPYE